MTVEPMRCADFPGSPHAPRPGRWLEVQFTHCPVGRQWSPAINAYRLADRLMVCIDLAGVDRESIDVHVEPRRLRISGVRAAPEPSRRPDERIQILTMEIDHGPFERELALPDNVQVDRISARHRNGLLWIRLPLDD